MFYLEPCIKKHSHLMEWIHSTWGFLPFICLEHPIRCWPACDEWTHWAESSWHCPSVQVKVTVLEDNDPFAQYHYLVTVYTGHRRGAVTSSKVPTTRPLGQSACPPSKAFLCYWGVTLAQWIGVGSFSLFWLCSLEERIFCQTKDYLKPQYLKGQRRSASERAKSTHELWASLPLHLRITQHSVCCPKAGMLTDEAASQ